MNRRKIGLYIFISLFILSLILSIIPDEMNLDHRLAGVSFKAPFGYDDLGRNLILQVARGTLVSISLSVSVVLCSFALGLILAYFMSLEGIWSNVFIIISDAFKVIPPIVLALFLASISGPGSLKLVIALTLASSSNISRTLYLKIKVLNKESYIKVARSYGMSNVKIFCSHILIQLWPYIREQGVSLLLSCILTEASLSYIGCGVGVKTPSLGGILSSARPVFLSYPHATIFPTIVLLLLSTSLVLVSKSLKDDRTIV